MDVNGTRFHLVYGRDDWARCRDGAGQPLDRVWRGEVERTGAACRGESEGTLDWSLSGGELTLQQCQFQLSTTIGLRQPRSERRGAGRDRYGNFYWIDESGLRVRRLLAGSGAVCTMWPPDPGEPEEPNRLSGFVPIWAPPVVGGPYSGLTVTAEHFLIVGTLDPPGLLAFDLHAAGPPFAVRWPAQIPFAPFDLASAPEGGLWILERGSAGAAAAAQGPRYWALDRHFGVVVPEPLPPLESGPPEPFQPVGGAATAPAATLRFPSEIQASFAFAVDASDPVAIEGLPDGTVLILDLGPPVRLLRYQFGKLLGPPVALQIEHLLTRSPTPGQALFGADIVFVAGAKRGHDRLYVTSADGTQAFAFAIRFQDQPTLSVEAAADEHWPMRLFGGKALVRGDGCAWYDVGPDRWAPLVEQPRPRFARSGTLITRVFDGRAPGCVWHRCLLDASLPPQASIEVWSRAADEAADLERLPWSPEPSPRRRKSGSELPFLRPPDGDHRCTFELLFQRARGRHLQLRLRLHGDGRTSPRLRAMRIWYPRFSYLEKYLPAVYREDPESATFLDGFLANLEGMFTSIEDRVAAAALLLDSRGAPAEALSWLAGFFGVALDPALDEGRRRLFIRHAMDFFRFRGTSRGILTALRLALTQDSEEELFSDQASPRPAEIRILESYRLRTQPSWAFGEIGELSGIRVVRKLKPGQRGAARWRPEEGGDVLRKRFHQRLTEGGFTELPGAFPTVSPGGESAGVWQGLCEEALGFIPATGQQIESAWRDYLKRRWRRIAALNAAHGSELDDFDGITLPSSLPPDGPGLFDWYQFQSIVLPVRERAHRFTVLLPVPARGASRVELHKQQRELASRIIELEKPAHTRFEVKFYWAMFRVGSARLGVDTLLDVGSRAPDLLPPLVLGGGALSESHLLDSPAERSERRRILGSDLLSLHPATEEKRE